MAYRMKLLILICTFSMFPQSVFAQIYKCKDASNVPIFTDKPCTVTQATVTTVSSAVKTEILVEHKDESEEDYLPSSITLKLRNLLERKRYRDLNVQLLLYQADAVSNLANEEDLLTAYTAFDYRTPEYGESLDLWVKSTPNSHQPYLARAYHSYGLAWAARGGKWSSETASDQIDKMNQYFAEAQIDIEAALRYGASSVIPFYLQLGIWKTRGPADDSLPMVMKRAQNKDTTEALEILDRALKVSPTSYLVRAQFMLALYPRWGGSYEAMARFSKLSQDYALSNPKIRWLEGFVKADIAFNTVIRGAFTKAEMLYDQSLLHGDNPEVLRDRGKNSYRQEQYQTALVYLDRSISAYSEDAKTYVWRSKTLRKLKDFDNAFVAYKQAVMLDPFYDLVEKERIYLASDFYNLGLESYNATDYVKAIECLGKSLQLNPEMQIAYYRRALSLYKLGKYDMALVDAKQAIEIDSSHYYSYALLDSILFKNRDWKQIIRYWNSYIAIKPDNPEAYFERAGTYYNYGDEVAFYRDLKTASDLGHIKAKEMLSALAGIAK